MDTQKGRGSSQAFGRLQIEVLEDRVTPSITLENPAGHVPQGDGANNGVAIEAVNPAGHAPHGHNK